MMKRVSCLVACLCLSLPRLIAGTVTDAEHQVSCEIPDTWTLNPDPSWPLLFQATNDFKTKTVSVASLPVANSYSLDDRKVVQGFEKDYRKVVDQIVSRKVITVAGARAYVINAGKREHGRDKSISMTIILANGHAYCITLMCFRHNAEEDAELQSVISSFHFISPPHIHASPVSAPAENSDTGRLFRIGAISLGLLIGACLLGVVVLQVSNPGKSVDSDDAGTLADSSSPQPRRRKRWKTGSHGRQGSDRREDPY